MRSNEAGRITRKIVGILIGIFILIPLLLFIFGEIVRSLWNWLMPMLFHLATITFWQALGLMFLSWLLFGGLRGVGRAGSGHRGNWRQRMHERWEQRWDRRWEQMSPEERDKFREWARNRCGPTSAGAGPNV